MGTELMTILLTALFILFVLILLVALVYSLARLMHDATTDAQTQQRFLNASILHVMNRAGR